jgi:acetyl esterase/lipase
MVLRILLLPLAGLMLGFSLLTVVRAPVAVNWKLALLAGEYGYVLALLPLGLAALIWLDRGPGPGLALAGIGACAVALGFLLKPVVEAVVIDQTLAARLEQAFGPARLPRPGFALNRLLAAKVPAVPVETREFAAGLKLDFRRPPVVSGRASCVVVIHGGGWDSGGRTEIAGFDDWLAHQGWAVAAIDYRLAPAHPWPAQRDDVLAAVAWLKAQAAGLGIDGSKLVLFGRSAGGQIAAAVGYTAHDPAIRGVIALYAPHDMPFVWSISRSDDALNSLKLVRQFMGGPPDAAHAEEYRTASAQLNVAPGITPPTLLLHGTLDTLVWRRHSVRLAARLDEARVPHLLVELPWAVHAFEFNPDGPGGQITRFSVAWFLRRVAADDGLRRD